MASAVDAVSPMEMALRMPRPTEVSDGGGSGCAEGVAGLDQPEELAVAGDVHACGSGLGAVFSGMATPSSCIKQHCQRRRARAVHEA